MAIDWNSHDLTFLRAQLEHGRVILFAGAGFSVDAKNRIGESPPLGKKLAELLAAKASIPYQNDSLPTVFDAVEPIIGLNNLWKYLADLYSIDEFADWYQIVSAITWYRIYTTNIDNLFQQLAPFRSKQRVNTIIYKDPPQDRDQLFDELQCIHLHGHVEHRAYGLTFTLQDLARHTARPDPWYQTLADDLQNCPVLFLGTTLEESILSHYLEIRDQKESDKREWRPRSFLVSPGVSPIRAASLRSRNIIAIDAPGKEFFESLQTFGATKDLNLRAVQCRVYPHLFQEDKAFGRAITNHFDLIVPTNLPPVKLIAPSRFFFGAEPTWDDIGERRDADRCVTDSLVAELLRPSDEFRCVALLGHAGSGKTTTIMRVAHELAGKGKTVFFARPTTRLDLTGLLDLLEKETSRERTFVVVDVVSQNLGSFAACRDRLKAACGLMRWTPSAGQFWALDKM